MLASLATPAIGNQRCSVAQVSTREWYIGSRSTVFGREPKLQGWWCLGGPVGGALKTLPAEVTWKSWAFSP